MSWDLRLKDAKTHVPPPRRAVRRRALGLGEFHRDDQFHALDGTAPGCVNGTTQGLRVLICVNKILIIYSIC